MTLSSEFYAVHDLCARRRTWENRYAPHRITLTKALNDSLYAALANGDATLAQERFMSLASNPGLDLPAANLYATAVHHSKLIEVIAQYVLSLDSLTVPGPVSSPWGEFQPLSFLTPRHTLLRVVLVERWDKIRERQERFQWRTAADTTMTGRPMEILAIVIGRVSEGIRQSPWTIGYRHPANGGIRIKKREGQFQDTWERVSREETDVKPLEWLGLMQADSAFEGYAHSMTEDVPVNREEVLSQMDAMAKEKDSLRQTRSACFKLRPCPFAECCEQGKTPIDLGWQEKLVATDSLKMLILA